ncbi:MAG: hypothetical protein HeimC3_41450 [Candidatus Heimdallarchaeota archaeon LC_3]|nr:MAG: hypothetical protein HeimC3_41450 [Candidatus Heimdallarchaeota archaeon LC_3]
MIKCSKCGLKNEPNLKKCINCGQYLGFLMPVVLVGDLGVGKQEFRERYCNTTQIRLMSTIGIDFGIKFIVIDERRIKFRIVVLSSKQRFSTQRWVHYLGILGAIVLFDVTK